MAALARLYQKISRTAQTYDGATLMADGVVLVRSTTLDINSATKRSVQLAYGVTDDGHLRLVSPFPTQVGKVCVSAVSPSGKLIALIRDLSEGGEPTSQQIVGWGGGSTKDTTDRKFKYCVEVWDGASLLHSIMSEGKHGAVLADDLLSSLSWSPDERRLVYVADTLPAKSKGFFEDANKTPASLRESLEFGTDDEVPRGRANDLREDWGEGYTGISSPTLFVVDLKNEEIRPVAGVPTDVSAGQAIFSPDGRSIVFTGWITTFSRLGLRYCANRHCALFAVSEGRSLRSSLASPEAVRLLAAGDPASMQASSPTFSPDGQHLYFLSSASLQVHQGCTLLRRIPWTTGATASAPSEVVVDCVRRVDGANDAAFPGLYVRRLPTQCWLSPSTLVVDSAWHSSAQIVAIDTTKKNAVSAALTLSAEARFPLASWRVLAAAPNGTLLAALGTHSSPTRLALYTTKSAAWSVVALSAAVADHVPQLSVEKRLVQVASRLPPSEGRSNLTTSMWNAGLGSSSAHDDNDDATGEDVAAKLPASTTPAAAAAAAAANNEKGGTPTEASEEGQSAEALNAAQAALSAGAGKNPGDAQPATAAPTPTTPSSASPLISIAPAALPTPSPVEPLASPIADETGAAADEAAGRLAASDDNGAFHYWFIESKFALCAPASQPVLLVLHGGPHSAFDSMYQPNLAFFAAAGYSVCAPNYRGSLGYGQAALESLAGRVGEQDVADCYRALQDCLSTHPHLDPARVCVYGGSHGGFLTGHLVAQYPRAFRAAYMRNPVLNLAVMSGVSDIPDWCYVETSGVVEETGIEETLQDSRSLAAMWRHSPMRRVRSIRTPCLFAVGGSDRRVPAHNALEMHRALRAQGTVSRVMVFPADNHGLEGVMTNAECVINGVQWFNRYATV